MAGDVAGPKLERVLVDRIPAVGADLWRPALVVSAPGANAAAGCGGDGGLTAGAWGATLYCLHCPEVSAIFVLTWYTLGISLAALPAPSLGRACAGNFSRL
jgi:hypothetical protein